MLASSIPTKFPFPFANSAGASFIRPVPVASQIGINPGAASDTDGFVPLNFLVPSAGGIPPDGRDVNGILNQITAWDLWQSIGGPVFYDAAQSTAVGGYPLGTLLNAVGIQAGYWWSEVDNNTSDPDTGGANWLFIQMINPATSPIGTQKVVTISSTGSHSYTPTTGARALLIQVQGAGGGGGATNSVPGSGNISVGISGGAGGFSQKYTLTSGLTFPATVVVGAAGTAGVSAGSGGTGGTSSFVCTGMTSVVCTGGGGGINAGTFTAFPAGTTTAVGGTASGGDINTSGGCSQSALMGSSNQALVGVAGASRFGVSPIQFGINASGLAGNGPGAGATGGLCFGLNSGTSGGAGAPGIVIITESF